MCVTLLTIWRLIKNFAAQIWEPFTTGPLTHHQSRPQASTTQLSTLSPAAISPLRARARFAGSLLIRFYSLHAVVCGVSVLILTHNNTPLGPTSTGTGTRSPGAGPPLVPTEHVGAARATAPGTIILVLERMLSEASVWRPPRARGHGTLLVSFWDIVWVALTRVDHVVTVIDTHHLPSRPTLSTRHGARAPVQNLPLPTGRHRTFLLCHWSRQGCTGALVSHRAVLVPAADVSHPGTFPTGG